MATSGKGKVIDWGGNTLIVDNIKVGAGKPGLIGSDIEELVSGGALDVTPGTAEAEKALVLDASADLTSGINDFTIDGDLTVTTNASVGGDVTVTGSTALGTDVVLGDLTLAAADMSAVAVGDQDTATHVLEIDIDGTPYYILLSNDNTTA